MDFMVWMSKDGGGLAGGLDDPRPQSVEGEEEFDVLATDDLAHRFHGALAALCRVSGIGFKHYRNFVLILLTPKDKRDPK